MRLCVMDQQDTIQARFAHARAALDEKEWLSAKLKGSREEAQRQQCHVDELAAELSKEQQDVLDLEKRGLRSMLQAIAGDREARLDKERAEALAAQLKHNAAIAELRDVQERIVTLEGLLAALGPADNEYQALLLEKQEWLIGQGGETGAELLERAEQQGRLTMKLREIDEAMEFAQEASNIMAKMLGYLHEARITWSTIVFDIFEDGCDRDKGVDAMGNAEVDAVDARYALARLENALKNLELGEFCITYKDRFGGFAERVLTTFVGDLQTENELQATEESVKETSAQVETVLKKLRALRDPVQDELVACTHRIALLVQAQDE